MSNYDLQSKLNQLQGELRQAERVNAELRGELSTVEQGVNRAHRDLLYAQVIIPAQFKHIFGQDNDSVFMSFRFKDIHRPIKQVDILSSEPSGFYGSETATVDQAKYYRYHQMLCGCSKTGLQRIYFLEQLGQIFL